MQSRKGAILAILILGLVIRLVHNSALMNLPLYFHPLGGHTAFIDLANAILGGDLIPGNRPFTENSPLYPYILAAQFYLSGGPDYLLPRLFGIMADTVTIFLIYRIAFQVFGSAAAMVAALFYAIYGPAVFFSAELIYVPYTSLFLSLSLWSLTSPKSRYLTAALAYGITITTLPTLIFGAPLILLWIWVSGVQDRVFALAKVLCGVVLPIVPFTLANYLNSGELVILTTSAGHNFYIGHNPSAQVGYYLPEMIGDVKYANRGSIFDSMKAVAEQSLNRELRDTEVSPFYFHRALESIQTDPIRELKLGTKRLLATFNDYEATTYSSYYFSRENSAVLRYLPTFQCLFPFAVIGAFFTINRRNLIVLMPITVSLLTILSFFYLSRFRMPAIPAFAILAGGGIAFIAEHLRSQSFRTKLTLAAILPLSAIIGTYPTAPKHGANEWNKLGALYRFSKKPELAEHAFQRALQSDPANINAKRNLILLYRELGRTPEALSIEETLTPQTSSGEEFKSDLNTPMKVTP